MRAQCKIGGLAACLLPPSASGRSEEAQSPAIRRLRCPLASCNGRGRSHVSRIPPHDGTAKKAPRVLARPHRPWAHARATTTTSWMLWTGRCALNCCTTAIHGTSFTWMIPPLGSSYLGIYAADSKEYNPTMPLLLTRPPPPAGWHGRCTTARSDIRSLPTTLVWYDVPGEGLPKRALRPTGSYRRASSPQVASACWCRRLGRSRAAIYCVMAGKSRCSYFLGVPERLITVNPPRPGTCCHPFPRYRSPVRIFTPKGYGVAAQTSRPISRSPSFPPVGSNLCRR